MRVILDLPKDPKFEVGSYLWLQRSDGRNLWQQRLMVTGKSAADYRATPVDEFHGYTP